MPFDRGSSSWTACLVALVLVAGLPVGARSDDVTGEARRLLETCPRSQTSGGVRFACEGFAASVAEYAGLSPREVLQIHLGSLKPLGDVSSTPGDFSAGGRRWPAVQFTVRRPDGSVGFEGHAAALGVRDRTARLVSCGAADAARLPSCDAIMELLAASGPAPYAVPKTAPAFLGRKVPIPKGCEVVNASDSQFRIRCGDLAAVAFFRLQAAEHVDRLSDTVREQILANLPGATDAEPRACRIGGEAARCKVVVAGSGAARSFFYIGGAVVRGVPVSVQCIQHAMVKGVHPVCASIITF